MPLAVLFPAPAQAVSFRFDFGSTVSDDFQQAANAAGEAWASELKDDLVVDLRIEFTDLSTLGGSILGGAQPGKLTVSYQDYIEATVKDAISSNDSLSLDSFQLSASDRSKAQERLSRPGRRNDFTVDAQEFSFLLDKAFDASVSAELPTSNKHSNYNSQDIVYFANGSNSSNHDFYGYQYSDDDDDDDYRFYGYQYSDDDDDDRYDDYHYDGYHYDDYAYIRRYQSSQNRNQRTASNGFIDDNFSGNNKNIVLTTAQAKALNLIQPSARGLDAVIKINNQVKWDFNQDDGIDSDRYDLASVLQHEIGHALGIVSSIDSLDFLAQSDQQTANIDEDRFSYLTPMDFYRYSDESADLGVMDLTFGGEKYFSLDGGKTVIRDASGRPVYFSTGSLAAGGDGYQGSHWREGNANPFGVMNPSLQQGRSHSISSVDLTLLDAIGWDLKDSVAERAEALGVNWQGIQNDIARERDDIIQSEIATWGDIIPDLEAAMSDISIEIDLDLARRIKNRFEALDDRLRYENNNRADIIEQFPQEVASETGVRNQQLRALPQEILSTDNQVRAWLDFSISALADRMQQASPLEINRLVTIVKNSPSEDRQRYESVLEGAIARFADQPSRLVQDLLETSGPANPIAYGFRDKWWFYYNLGDDDTSESNAASNSSLVYYSDAYYPNMAYLSAAPTDSILSAEQLIPKGLTTDKAGDHLQPLSGSTLSLSAFEPNYQGQNPKDVPEPSSVLALFGIAALSAGAVRRSSR